MEHQNTIADKSYGATGMVCIYKDSTRDKGEKQREKRLLVHIGKPGYTIMVDPDTGRKHFNGQTTFKCTDIYDALGYYNSITL